MSSAVVEPRRTGASVRPLDLSSVSAIAWIVGMMAVGLLAYYFIGVDQGATSVFGNDAHVHEYVHDARHFLGFPCH